MFGITSKSKYENSGLVGEVQLTFLYSSLRFSKYKTLQPLVYHKEGICYRDSFQMLSTFGDADKFKASEM